MKTIVIGCIALPDDAVARKIIEMGLEEKVEIVIVRENKPPEIKELSKEIMQLAVPMQMTFEKKKKHQIKGHKHQYKFHQ